MASANTSRRPCCLGAIDDAREAGGVVRCASCATPHHGACFAEHTGCTIHHAPPWPERAPSDDEARRARLQATVARPGRELKSAHVAVVLTRRRRRRAAELQDLTGVSPRDDDPDPDR